MSIGAVTHHRAMADRFREVVRFLGVGLGATALDMLLFWGLVSILECNETAGYLIAFYTSVTCRFFFDQRYTFRNDRANTAIQLRAYASACTLTALIGIAAFHAALWAGFPPLAAKAVSIPLVTASGYMLFRRVVFTRPR